MNNCRVNKQKDGTITSCDLIKNKYLENHNTIILKACKYQSWTYYFFAPGSSEAWQLLQIQYYNFQLPGSGLSN